MRLFIRWTLLDVLALLLLWNRIMVMHDCTVAAILERSDATEENILSNCFGYRSGTVEGAGPAAAGTGSKKSPVSLPRIV
jgi:hypothetical protein